MTELRLRSRISEAELALKLGKIVTDGDYNVLLTGAATVRKPNGQPLCVYLPGGIQDATTNAYTLLTKIRSGTQNRHTVAGTAGSRNGPGGTMHVARPIMSNVLGALDPSIPRFPHCRLTAYTARDVERWEAMRPLWQAIARQLERNVPDRYAAQAREAERTRPEWVIPGTPFTTITVNNSYATGVHYDKGDLDAGFSCLGVMRRGAYTGGYLTFPEYRLAVDMRDGDLLLMDAHEAHGNTAMTCACGALLPGGAGRLPPAEAKQRPEGPCPVCGAERISVVCYFRTKMVACGSPSDEDAKYAQKRGLVV